MDIRGLSGSDIYRENPGCCNFGPQIKYQMFYSIPIIKEIEIFLLRVSSASFILISMMYTNHLALFRNRSVKLIDMRKVTKIEDVYLMIEPECNVLSVCNKYTDRKM